MDKRHQDAKRRRWETIRRQLKLKTKLISSNSKNLSKSISFNESMLRSAMLKINNRALANEVQALKMQVRRGQDEIRELKNEIIDLRTSGIEGDTPGEELQRMKAEREDMSKNLSKLNYQFFQSSSMILEFVNKFCATSETASAVSRPAPSPVAATCVNRMYQRLNNMNGTVAQPSTSSASTSQSLTSSELPMRVPIVAQRESEDDVSEEYMGHTNEGFAPNVSVIMEQSFCSSPGQEHNSLLSNQEQNTIFEAFGDASLSMVNCPTPKGDTDLHAKTSLEVISMVDVTPSMSSSITADTTTTTASHKSPVVHQAVPSPVLVVASASAIDSPGMPFVTRRRTSRMSSLVFSDYAASPPGGDDGHQPAAPATQVTTTPTGCPGGSLRRCRTSIFQAVQECDKSRRHTTQNEILNEVLVNVPISPSVPPPKKRKTTRSKSKSKGSMETTTEAAVTRKENERPRRQRRDICYEEIKLNVKMRQK